ncbi:MAG: DNA primase [Panacagrimonas sp.]
MAGGLIPQSFIQDLLARTDIVEVVGSRLELKRAGREFKALSPFTNEKSPSFYVSPAKQFYHCFSSGKSGNAIGFLMEHERLTFVEAVEELAGRAGLEVPREGGQFERLVLDGPLDALAAAERFFREALRKHPPAIEYLKKRGVSGETAKTFGIGFAPDSWDALAHFFDEPKHAVEAGLLKKKEETGRVFDVFRNRVMFPIRDTRGRVIAFGGRTLADDPAKYLNSPETALFHKGKNLFGLYEAKQSRKSVLPYLIVVEGYMDTVMLAQHDIREVVATLGTATTREHLSLLFKSTSRVVFCFDGDRAGRSAAWRALEQALPEVDEKRECQFMFLPDGHDPDTLVQEIGTEAFRKLVDEALPLSTFLLGELGKQVNLGHLDGRAKLAGLAKPFVSKMRESPLRSLLVDELSRLTRLRREEFGAAAETAPSPGPAAGARTTTAESGSVRAIKRALQLLLERPDLAERVAEIELLSQAQMPGIGMLVEAVEFFHENPSAHGGQLHEYWRGTPKAAALERLGPLAPVMDDAGIEREFADAINHLRQKALKTRIQGLLAEAQVRTLSKAETAEIEQLTRQLSSKPLV